MKTRRRKIAAGLAALVALALGGAAVACGTFDDEQPLEGTERTRASTAALKATGGGIVNEPGRDSESTVDVRLDDSYGSSRSAPTRSSPTTKTARSRARPARERRP